ncbi:TULIP family P47-like protein [Cytobacillus sp. IB215316]|uniref:TULIP family P47-like protein n=1 Tax=Cytobacillus sp. IB215316 TaxID=3097354 RepID=UPI002A15C6C4|nr:TULIP family P47-like protein [Cytobacillus sp. IB215316]MDX8362982.1 TULIP family P47-like protein [Cytobacillus sp. IB215316]
MSSYPIIDLFGWDTTYAISYKNANDAIRNLGSTPAGFDYQDPQLGQINGAWGDWEITTKSDGQNLVLKCPVLNGLYISGVDKSVTTLDGGWVEIEVKLTFIEQKEQDYFDFFSIQGTGRQNNLMIQKSDNPDVPTVSLENAEFNYNSVVSKALGNQLFLDYFEKNILTDFKHVFSKFIVGQSAAKGQFLWLKPTSLHYALSSYNESEDEEENLEKSVFGVLAMTEDRKPPVTGHNIDARMIPASSASSAFAISDTRFVENWLRAGVLAMNLGSKPEDYKIQDDGLTITNKNEMHWTSFKDVNGKIYDAKIPAESFTMTLDNSEIKVEFTDLNFPVDKQVTAHLHVIQHYGVSLGSGTDADGNTYRNVLQLDELKDPIVNINYSNKADLKEQIISIAVSVVVMSLIGYVGKLKDIAEVADAVAEDVDEGIADAAANGEDTATTDLFESAKGVSDAMSPEDEELFNKEVGNNLFDTFRSAYDELDEPLLANDYGSNVDSWAKFEQSGDYSLLNEEPDEFFTDDWDAFKNQFPETEDALDKGAENAEEAGQTEDGTAEEEQTSKYDKVKNAIKESPRKMGEFLKSHKYRIRYGFYSALIGGPIGSAPELIDYMAKKKWSKVPSIDEFGQTCVNSVQWPENSGFKLETASLHSSLLLGGELVPVIQDKDSSEN